MNHKLHEINQNYNWRRDLFWAVVAVFRLGAMIFGMIPVALWSHLRGRSRVPIQPATVAGTDYPQDYNNQRWPQDVEIQIIYRNPPPTEPVHNWKDEGF